MWLGIDVTYNSSILLINSVTWTTLENKLVDLKGQQFCPSEFTPIYGPVLLTGSCLQMGFLNFESVINCNTNVPRCEQFNELGWSTFGF